MLNAIFISLAPLLLSLNMKTNFEGTPVSRMPEKYPQNYNFQTFLNRNMAESIIDYSYTHMNPGLMMTLFPATPKPEGFDGDEDEGFHPEDDSWLA